MFRLPKSSNPPAKSSNPPAKKKPSIPAPEPVVKPQKNQGICKSSHRKCSFPSLENFDYCMKHILEDKSSPYKPCLFLYTVSGKKCGKPALRQERKDTWFCAEHNRKTQLQKQRALSRHAPPKTQEALFATLGHYVPSDQAVAKKDDSAGGSSTEGPKVVDPFVDIDASKVNNRVNQVLEYASESDSDVEMAMLDSVWRAQDQESSDAESVDSQHEDPLKHAGTYTAEEVTIIIKDKMLRLQSLYIDQFRRLHHLLREKRRKYLHAVKKEKETLCSIHDQEKNTAKEQKLYEKLKALNRYHKYHGVEAILHKKALELRAKVTEGHQLRTSHKGKCAFTEGGVKCGAKTLPVTKYCRKHILEDTQQVLFRSCGVKRDDHVCQEPTLNVFENATCVYHTVLPSQPYYRLEKFERKEDQDATGNNILASQTDSEAFANVEDSEEFLIKDILKPTGLDSSGKPVTVDALELSRTVSDILALAEAHTNVPDLGQITVDKPLIDPSLKTSSSEVSKAVLDQINKHSSSNVNKSLADHAIEASNSETKNIKSDTNQSLDTLYNENAKPVNNVVSPAESLDSVNKSTAVPSSQTIEFNSAKSSLGKKMDIEDEKPTISPNQDSCKEENSQDLMMVDMMTDVGVVEEVLDDQVVEPSESVSSEKESEGIKQEISGSDEQIQPVEQVMESKQQETVSKETDNNSLELKDGSEQIEQKVALNDEMPDEDKRLSEKDLEESDKTRVSEYQVVSEHQYAEMGYSVAKSSSKQHETVNDEQSSSVAGSIIVGKELREEKKKDETEEPMEVDSGC